jgi:hypothetical protein
MHYLTYLTVFCAVTILKSTLHSSQVYNTLFLTVVTVIYNWVLELIPPN